MGKSDDQTPLPNYNADQPQLPSQPEPVISKVTSKWSKLQLRKARLEAEQALRSEKRFAKSRLGKWWIPIRERMKETRSGRIKLRILAGTQILALLALLFFARPLISGAVQLGGDLISPPAYTLTAAQEAEGYDRTCSGKNCIEDDVYFRFYSDSDYATDADCKDSYTWCVYAIPRDTECEQIYMQFSTSEKDGLLASTLENLTATKNPASGKWIEPGQRVTLGVVSKNEKSTFGLVDTIYCRTRD